MKSKLSKLSSGISKKYLFLTGLLFLVFLVLLVSANVGNYIDIVTINTSSGSSTAGGGFVVSSTNGHLTNGTGFAVAQAGAELSTINVSRIININVSLIRNLSHGGFVNVTFGWLLSKTNGSTMLNTTLRENTTGNQTMWNFSFNTNLLPDGVYNISVYVQNESADAIYSQNIVVNYSRAVDVAVDNTPPNVTAATLVFGNYSGFAGHDGRYVGLNLSAGLSAGNYTLWVVVNDSTTYVQGVRFNLSNSSGSVVPFNYTATRNDTNYTTGSSGAGNIDTKGSFNVSRLAEGWYNLTVWTNDTLDNVNNSLRMTFVLDRTAPSVSVTCSPSEATAGQTVTCTCTFTDNYPGSGLLLATTGFGTGSSSESTTATGSGSFSSSECRARDYAGNLGTATGSWTVTAASSGGGGGGGSGGGISSGAVGTFEKKVWTSIEAGETATVAVRNSALGVTEVSFSVEETTHGAVVEVKKVDSLPSTVESYSASVYKTLQITEKNVEKALKGTATISFKVEKKWLTGNTLSKGEVALHRYSDGQWNELTTSVKSEDDSYVYYAAQTPGFSYFVIAKRTAAAPTVEKAVGEEAAVPVVEAPVEAPAEVPTEEAVTAEKVKRGQAVWLVPVLVLLVVLGLLYWYWGRKR